MARMDTAAETVKAIRGAMRDPDSLVVDSIGVDQNGDVACVAYRARNGFGGVNRESAILVGRALKKATTELWTKHCVQLVDMKWSLK